MAEEKFEKIEWKPKTEIGRKVKSGEITSLDEIVDKGIKIMETEIVDTLLPNLETDFMLIGQAKGKFGGGQRRLFRQTQKKTAEGNVPSFATFGIIGNKDGFFGVSTAKGKETVPARDKSIRLAKLNVHKIRRGCGSWECNCGTPHSIPFRVSGKCGSVEIVLLPAPKGTGLCIEKECQKMLRLAGIKDVWSQTKGRTKSKINLIYACYEALKKLMEMRISKDDVKHLGIEEGKLPEKVKEKIKKLEELEQFEESTKEKPVFEEEADIPDEIDIDEEEVEKPVKAIKKPKKKENGKK